MANLFGGIMTLVLSIILIASVVISTVKTQNVTGWTTGEVALWGLISLVAIMGLVYSAGSIFGLFG
jgi:hypothetical protein